MRHPPIATAAATATASTTITTTATAAATTVPFRHLPAQFAQKPAVTATSTPSTVAVAGCANATDGTHDNVRQLWVAQVAGDARSREAAHLCRAVQGRVGEDGGDGGVIGIVVGRRGG